NDPLLETENKLARVPNIQDMTEAGKMLPKMSLRKVMGRWVLELQLAAGRPISQKDGDTPQSITTHLGASIRQEGEWPMRVKSSKSTVCRATEKCFRISARRPPRI